MEAQKLLTSQLFLSACGLNGRHAPCALHFWWLQSVPTEIHISLNDADVARYSISCTFHDINYCFAFLWCLMLFRRKSLHKQPICAIHIKLYSGHIVQPKVCFHVTLRDWKYASVANHFIKMLLILTLIFHACLIIVVHVSVFLNNEDIAHQQLLCD